MIVRMLKMIVKVIVLKIVYVGVLMRLVSITPGHVKLDWLPPPPKVDRINDKDREDDKDKSNDDKSNDDGKDYNDDREDDKEDDDKSNEDNKDDDK